LSRHYGFYNPVDIQEEENSTLENDENHFSGKGTSQTRQHSNHNASILDRNATLKPNGESCDEIISKCTGALHKEERRKQISEGLQYAS
jgi:hypothetical protein